MIKRPFSVQNPFDYTSLLARTVALGLAGALLVTSLHDVSTAWDVWYYHLPFASRIWKIAPSFAFSAENEARFHGFPLLAEALQGLFWKLTGRPESANLVCLLALWLLVDFGRRRLGVARSLGFVALLAIPMVQMHASSAYIDLPANALAAALYFVALERGTDRSPARWLTELTILATLLSCMRFQMIPLVLLAFVFALPRAWKSGAKIRSLFFAAPLLVFILPWKNLIAHHNPFYPVRFQPLGIPFAFAEETYEASPVYLEHASRPLRWLASIFEIRLAPIASHARWSIDQYTLRDDPGYRMGGFFGAYVAVLLVALVVVAIRRRSDLKVKQRIVSFAVLSAVVSVLPQSHECRYYLVWMLVLVLTCGELFGPALRTIHFWGALLCIGIVGSSTQWIYLHPSGLTFSELIAEKVERSVVEQAKTRGTLCLRRQPWNILYSAEFQRLPVGTYRTKEAVDADECGGETFVQ